MANFRDNSSHRTLTNIALAVVVVGVMYWARSVVIPFALAVFLAFILNPMATRLRRWGVGRVPSVLITVALAAVVVLGTGWVVSSQVGALISELPDHVDRIHNKVESVKAWLKPDSQGRFGALIDEVARIVEPEKGGEAPTPIPVVVEASKPMWLSHLEGLVSPAAEAAGQAGLAILLVVFLLLGREDMRNRMIRLIGPSRHTATTRAIDDAASRISRFLRAQLLVNAGFGALFGIALMAISVKYALLWGFVAAVMRYVPFVGTVFGLLPPLVAAVTMTDDWYQPAVVLAVHIVLEILANTVAEPLLFGQSLGLSEVALVVAAALWAFLWGPIGLILSGPLTACLLVLGRHVPQLRSLEVILGHEQPLPPNVTFFQRLIARDADEAAEIAAAYAKAHSPERAIDDLAIPTLGGAHDAIVRGELLPEEGEFVSAAVSDIADSLQEAIAPTELELGAARIKVLAVPASGSFDAAAIEMLANRLDRRYWDVECMPTAALASDIVGHIEFEQPAIVVVVALLPGGFTHLRYLSKRIVAAASDAKLLIGRWGGGTLATDEVAKLRDLGASEVTASLHETVQRMQSWRSVLAGLGSSSRASDQLVKAGR